MRHFFLVLYLFSNLFLFSQNEIEKDSIRKIERNNIDEQPFKDFFAVYFHQIQIMDLDALLNKVHPGLFTIIPKETMKQQFEQSFSSDEIETKFLAMDYRKVDDAFIFENTKYYLIDYKSIFSLTVKQSEDQSVEYFSTMVNLMEGFIKNQYKEEHVTRKENVFTIDEMKKIILIDDPNWEDYKMLELKPEMKDYYKVFLPEIIVNYLIP
jgi:hypothetical protein